MKETRLKSIQVALPADLRREAMEIKKQHRVSMSQLVRDGMRAEIKRLKRELNECP